LLEGLVGTPPTSLARQPVTRTQALTTNDGFKFFVDDGSWLLIRTSGTEPLVRVYTEASSPDAQEALIGAGEKLVRG
ncbi:MAG: phosphoglucomutase/phosphomannomutase family protein, partial [Chloroflexi bacterium]|nr:phosphoglucomutase/phosphomannomutase family protein [Chloroflexota bacterium]